jgi:hypothetical protein
MGLGVERKDVGGTFFIRDFGYMGTVGDGGHYVWDTWNLNQINGVTPS